MADEILDPVEDRNWQIEQGHGEAERNYGTRLLWPETLGGPGIPCRPATDLEDASRLRAEGGGVSLFDDVIVSVDLAQFKPPRIPAALDPCRYKVGPNAAWRAMKIESVTYGSGGKTIILRLNSRSQNA